MKNLTYACFLETFGQDTCSAEADGDLRSGRVLGQETGTIRMGTGALGWVPPPL